MQFSYSMKFDIDRFDWSLVGVEAYSYNCRLFAVR